MTIPTKAPTGMYLKIWNMVECGKEALGLILVERNLGRRNVKAAAMGI